jgi:hypothetical protein
VDRVISRKTGKKHLKPVVKAVSIAGGILKTIPSALQKPGKKAVRIATAAGVNQAPANSRAVWNKA